MKIRLLPLFFVCAAAAAQTPPADLRGVYVFSSDVSQISNPYAQAVTQSLGVDGVDGLAVNIGWKAVEPAMGQYEWEILDQWIGEAISLGRKIELEIQAGDDTPAWLFDPPPGGAGAAPLDFTVSPHSGATGVCIPETIAAPWDPAFLGRWDSLLAALAEHLKTAGTDDAITLVRLTGINRTTDELRLPAETAQSTGLACVSNALTTWQQAGYRPSKLLAAWDAITSSFLSSFPDKVFSAASIPNNPFPRIDENGSIITGPVPDQNWPLLMLAAGKLPKRLVVQVNFLIPGQPAAPEVVKAARDLGTLAAFQTNNYFGSGAACAGTAADPIPCTSDTYLELLETGIYPLGVDDSLRAQYIEVFPDNATAFPDDILRAHLELRAPRIDPVPRVVPAHVRGR